MVCSRQILSLGSSSVKKNRVKLTPDTFFLIGKKGDRGSSTISQLGGGLAQVGSDWLAGVPLTHAIFLPGV